MRNKKLPLKVGDFVWIKNGKAMSRVANPKGEVQVKILELSPTHFRGVITGRKVIYVYAISEILEEEISTEEFNPSKRLN